MPRGWGGLVPPPPFGLVGVWEGAAGLIVPSRFKPAAPCGLLRPPFLFFIHPLDMGEGLGEIAAWQCVRNHLHAGSETLSHAHPPTHPSPPLTALFLFPSHPISTYPCHSHRGASASWFTRRKGQGGGSHESTCLPSHHHQQRPHPHTRPPHPLQCGRQRGRRRREELTQHCNEARRSKRLGSPKPLRLSYPRSHH